MFERIGNIFTGNDDSPSPSPSPSPSAALPPTALAPAPVFGLPAFQQLLAVDPNKVGGAPVLDPQVLGVRVYLGIPHVTLVLK